MYKNLNLFQTITFINDTEVLYSINIVEYNTNYHD